MLRINDKEIIGIYFVKNGVKITIAQVKVSSGLIWQAIRSCFGSGTWRNDKPWKNTERWKNNA